ncbi:hypothetical protein SAMN05660690_4373 [Geodermatophilus telluris]|uniref:ARB-07466-like C-terminal domain-containing protein n=1 Tax=Geodermatophilus telluris TaxID=1190417 RepID=A0A1G6V7B4_9ACTN|nr:hypothetical protein [Geodermatophilus telluris]SDD49570.1 hypothetical protein SAMN05660690_4373 [Geodermatophilus telluris]
MDPRTTSSGRATRSRRAARLRATRRPGLLLGAAAAGALLVNVVVGADPAARAGADTPRSVGVAAELGLTAQSGALDAPADLQPLEDLAASRGSREVEEVTAQQVQAAADQAALDQQRAAAEAAAAAQRAAEEAAAAQAAAEAAADAAAAEEAAAAEAAASEAAPAASSSGSAGGSAGGSAAGSVSGSSTAATATARITNTAGPVAAVVQAAANAVVSNVAGAGSITLGGTRASAADPGGHPSGLALDYMVMSDTALGNAIVAYHVAHWDELGVDYLIYQQEMLSSPGGSWSAMADRGSATANHLDHVHVNYAG